MHVLICPDKFRGSLSAQEATLAIVRGVKRALPRARVTTCALADGGEGSLAILQAHGAEGLVKRRLRVAGPLRKPVQATYLLGGGRAIIEAASACGLHLVPPSRRHPENTTSIGVGMLIEDAVARGATDITLLLGGSATSDAGAGMAAALGYRFFSIRGDDFVPMADSLQWVHEIDGTNRLTGLTGVTFRAACDVLAPLLGPAGAMLHYAQQKGARVEELPNLERGMHHFVGLLDAFAGKSFAQSPGAGAAGGLGAGAAAFLGADLVRGTDYLFGALGLPTHAATADLVITGEGRVDRQTLQGKLVAGVIALGRPTVVVCGQADISADELGATRILSIVPMMTTSPSEALLRASGLIEQLVAEGLADLPLSPPA